MEGAGNKCCRQAPSVWVPNLGSNGRETAEKMRHRSYPPAVCRAPSPRARAQ